MDIEGVKEKRRELEVNITDLVQEFARETGVYVCDIDVSLLRMERFGAPSLYVQGPVEVEVTF